VKKFYKVSKRNNKYLPALGCAFVTADYLTGVRFGRIHCPNYDEIRLKSCADPPKKDVLIKELIKVQEARKFDLNLREGGPKPNKRWLVDLLATYSPQLYIFDKDYYPQDRKPPRVLSNDDNWFTGLPDVMYTNEKIKRSRINKPLEKE
jgi:hypothetical protein